MEDSLKPYSTPDSMIILPCFHFLLFFFQRLTPLEVPCLIKYGVENCSSDSHTHTHNMTVR